MVTKHSVLLRGRCISAPPIRLYPLLFSTLRNYTSRPRTRPRDTDVQSFVTSFSSEGFPSHSVWSLADLIRRPEKQKELRAQLELMALDEYQFLRWRNALAAPDLGTALGALAHNLITTPSLFDPTLPTGGKFDSNLPFNQPSWLALALVNSKIRKPQDLRLAYEWSQYIISEHQHSVFGGSFVTALIEAAAKIHFYSRLPALVDVFISLRRPALTLSDFHRTVSALAPTPGGEVCFKSAGDAAGGPLIADCRKDAQLIRVLMRMERSGFSVMGQAMQKVIIGVVKHLGLPAIRFLRKRVTEKSSELSYSLSVQALSLYAAGGMTRQAALELDAIRRTKIKQGDPVVPISSGYNKSAYLGQLNPAPVRPAVNIKTRGQINREVITHLNTIFLHSFARDRRSRDSCRIPHALFAYVQRLRLHIDSKTNAGRSAKQKDRLLSTLFIALSAQEGFSSNKLLAALEGIDTSHLDTAALASVLKGLARRGDASGAMHIWAKYMNTQQRHSNSQFAGATIHVFAANDRLADAFSIIDSRGEGGRHTLDISIISDFIRKLAHANHPHLCYYFWDNMEAMYGIRPNDLILNTILITASNFSSRERASGVTDLLGIGWSKFRSQSAELAKRNDSRSPQEHSAYIRSVLDREIRTDDGFWWQGNLAWQRARDIFREIVLGNWPELKGVDIPARANSTGMASLVSGHPFSLPRFTRLIKNKDTEYHRLPIGNYYDVIPSRRSFDAYMRLLCAHDLADEIPEALAWQRALGVAPTRHTLRLALTRFAEVGESPPIFEDAKERIGLNLSPSPIEKLRAWVIDWVGENNCPSEKELAMTRAMIGYHGGAGAQGKESREWKEYEKMLERRKATFRRNRGDLRRRENRTSRWIKRREEVMLERRVGRKAKELEWKRRKAMLG